MLKNLQELQLDRNKLEGIIPGANVTDYSSAITGMLLSRVSFKNF
ncbi:hypothetical protein Hanom_Chr06g00542671 [Helianthus anomalus]